MSLANGSPVVRRASHGVVSLVAGFLSGVVLFLVVGAGIGDAVFSALVLALLVTTTRALTGR